MWKLYRISETTTIINRYISTTQSQPCFTNDLRVISQSLDHKIAFSDVDATAPSRIHNSRLYTIHLPQPPPISNIHAQHYPTQKGPTPTKTHHPRGRNIQTLPQRLGTRRSKDQQDVIGRPIDTPTNRAGRQVTGHTEQNTERDHREEDIS